MSKTRFTQWIVFACIGTLAGCTSGEGGTAGNTELNVVVPTGGGSSAPAGIDIQVVEYTINCDAPDPTATELGVDTIEPTFNPDVTINGVLEVLDTASGGVTSQDFGVNLDEVYVWQGFMDIPLNAVCTVQLRARDGDGEVICTDTVDFDTQPPFIAGDQVKVNVLMYCGISFQAPVANLDLDGDFSFNISNFCPDLFVLNCIDSEIDIRTIPGIGEVAATACQVRARDGDSQCGDSCDPQTCVADTEGLTCTAGPEQSFCTGGDSPGAPCAQARCTGGDNPGAACGADMQCQGTSPTPDGSCDPTTAPGECGGTSPTPDGTCSAGPQTTVSCGPSVCNLPGSPFNGGACTIGDATACGGSPAACTPNPLFVCAIPGALFGTPCIPAPGETCFDLSSGQACVPNAVLDCTGTNTPAGACVFNGDVLGAIGGPAPGPLAPGPGGFFVACVTADNDGDPGTPKVAVTPGAIVTCQAVTTDGDNDCDKVKTVELACPGLSPCEAFGGDAACQAATGTVCISSVCDDSSGSAVCVDTNETGNDCSAELPPNATCQAGVCVSNACTSDASCETTDECTFAGPGICDIGTGNCGALTPEPNTTSCDAGGGAGTGTCDGAGTCVDNCAGVVCTTTNECFDPGTCDSLTGTCSAEVPDDTNTCTSCVTGTCLCDAGVCIDGTSCPAVGPQIVRNACRNSFNQVVSTFPVTMTATLPGDVCPVANTAFSVDIDPIIALDIAFLQAAADTLCTLSTALTQADVTLAQVGVDAFAGASCTPQLSSDVPGTVVLDVTVTGVCGSGGSVTVNSGTAVPLPQVTLPCTADNTPGADVALCSTGTTPLGNPVSEAAALIPPNLDLSDPPVDTWLGVSVGGGTIVVSFSCGSPGTVAPDPGTEVGCGFANSTGASTPSGLTCAADVGTGDFGETQTGLSWTDPVSGFPISDCNTEGGPPDPAQTCLLFGTTAVPCSGTCTAIPVALDPLTECITFAIDP